MGRARITVLVVTLLLMTAAVPRSVSAQAYVAPVGMEAVTNPRNDVGRDLDREEAEDLRIKVSGGFVSLRRNRVGNNWTFNPSLGNLVASGCGQGFVEALTTASRFRTLAVPSYDCYSSIQRGDFTYSAVPNSSPPRFVSGTNSIVESATTLQWADPNGRWVLYQRPPPATGLVSGQVMFATSFGDRNGTIATLQRDAQNRITGFIDRFGQQVLTLEYDASGNVVRAVDYTGRQVLYGYSGANLVTFTDVRGNTWTDQYSGNVLISRTDPEGRVTTFLRNGDSTLEGIKDQDGFGVDYSYDYDSQAQQVYFRERFSGNRVVESWFQADNGLVRRDLNGRTILRIRKDGNDRIFTDENSNDTRVQITDNFQVTGIVYPDGSSLHMELVPGLGVPKSITNENGIVTSLDNDAQGNPITIREAAGRPEDRVTQRAYDAYGQLITQRQVVDGGAGDRITTVTYDAHGNVAAVTDPEGNLYMAEYDVLGDITQLTDPRGKIWHLLYDSAGNLVQTRDPLGGTVTYEYDRIGNLLRVTDETAAVTAYTYNRQNNITQILDALGNTWQYQYTEAAQLKAVIDPESLSLSYSYDRDGRLASFTDGNGNVTTYGYLPGQTAANPAKGPLLRITYPTFVREWLLDARYRIATETDIDITFCPLGSGICPNKRLVTQWTYDFRGNVTRLTTPDGRASRLTYDAYDRLIQQVQTDGANIAVQWDLWAQTLRVTDPRELTTTLRYDKIGRMVSETMPNGGVTQFGYDGNSNVTSVVDPRNEQALYGYDDRGLVAQQQTFPVAGGTTASRNISYTYNSRGDLLGYADSIISGGFAYDAMGQIVSSSVNFGAFSTSAQYAFYRNGRVRSYTPPDGVVYTYTYDGDGKLQTLSIPGQGTITVNGRKWLLQSRVTLPGGVLQQYQYDSRLRMVRATSTDSAGNVILDHQYQWDDADLLTQNQTEHGTYRFAYDDAYRLISADNPTLPSEAYAYDPSGNRLPADPTLQPLWSYGSNNELLATDTATYTYDAAGNLIGKTTSGGLQRYFYDEQSRLTRVESGTGDVVAQYGYDPFGRRLWKETGGSRTYFYYTGEGLTGEFDASGNLLRSYGWKPDSAWITGPLFIHDQTGYGYYHNDQLGTPRKLTDSTGQVVWAALYSSFGVAQPQVQTVNNPLRFPGQYFDAETALHQNSLRDYDPQIGRYLQSDPIGLAGGINRYSYAYDDPIRFSDSTGEAGTPSPPLILLGGTLTGFINAEIYIWNPWEHDVTLQGAFGAFLGGFASGAIGTFAPGGWPGILTNAAGGAIGSGFTAAVDPCQPFRPFSSAILGAAGGTVPGRFFPTKGRLPSTWPGIIPKVFGGSGTTNLNRIIKGVAVGTFASGALQTVWDEIVKKFFDARPATFPYFNGQGVQRDNETPWFRSP